MNLTFFFPYKEVSGVPVLFRRMAETLSARHGLRTTVVDYADGYMAKSVRPEFGVRVRVFEKGVSFPVDDDTILVMQSLLPSTIRPELRIAPSTRILFWTLHPQNLIQNVIPLRRIRDYQARSAAFHHAAMNTVLFGVRNRLRRMVSLMADKKSIFFMDGSTLRFTEERLGACIEDPIFMPVPANDALVDGRQRGQKSLLDKTLSVAWVGRLCDFKIWILMHTIQRIADYARQKNIRVIFHIIGDGPEARRLDRLHLSGHSVTLVRPGVIAGEDLNDYLLKHVDILFAMGASALEGARLGIPTVLLDASYGPLSKPYRFKWLTESDKYSLGEMISDSHFEAGCDSMAAIIEDAERRYDEISQATQAYYAKHHSIDSVCHKFNDRIEQVEFRYRDFEPDILKRGVVRKSYEFVRDRLAGNGAH